MTPCSSCHPERRSCREGSMELPASSQALRFTQHDKQVLFLVCHLLHINNVRIKNSCCPPSIFLADAVTQSLGGCDPEVVTLKVHAENIVVCWSCLHRDALHLAARVAHQHLRLVGAERGTVHRPVCAVVVSQTLVGREPRTIRI